MQLIPREYSKPDQLKVTEKELTILYEIGLNYIPTATDFVEMVAEKYQVSHSGVWYTLKKLKKEHILDFTEKGEEQRPLGLTELGMQILRSNITDVDDRQYHRVNVVQM